MSSREKLLPNFLINYIFAELSHFFFVRWTSIRVSHQSSNEELLVYYGDSNGIVSRYTLGTPIPDRFAHASTGRRIYRVRVQ